MRRFIIILGLGFLAFVALNVGPSVVSYVAERAARQTSTILVDTPKDIVAVPPVGEQMNIEVATEHFLWGAVNISWTNVADAPLVLKSISVNNQACVLFPYRVTSSPGNDSIRWMTEAEAVEVSKMDILKIESVDSVTYQMGEGQHGVVTCNPIKVVFHGPKWAFEVRK